MPRFTQADIFASKKGKFVKGSMPTCPNLCSKPVLVAHNGSCGTPNRIPFARQGVFISEKGQGCGISRACYLLMVSDQCSCWVGSHVITLDKYIKYYWLGVLNLVLSMPVLQICANILLLPTYELHRMLKSGISRISTLLGWKFCWNVGRMRLPWAIVSLIHCSFMENEVRTSDI